MFRRAFPQRLALLGALCVFSLGCATRDVPQAHRALYYNRTGLLQFYTGKKGFDQQVLKPGTQFLGVYDELRLVDCSMATTTESLDTLTKDGVHFGFDVSVRYSADCSDEAVRKLVNAVSPTKEDTITAVQLYGTFIQPAIGEAAREFVSPLRANELNEKQADILVGVKKRFLDMMREREQKLVLVHEVNIKNLHFPQQMDQANLERATQAVLRDKAVAERERVTAEIETMRMRKELVEREADAIAAKIDLVGAALKRNPQYLQYDLQLKMPEIYREAGSRGNLVLAAPSPITWSGAQVPWSPSAPPLPELSKPALPSVAATPKR